MRRKILIFIIACACNMGLSRAQELDDYLQQARGGNTVAQYNTAICYLHGLGTDPNPTLWHHYMRFAAEGGEEEAQNRLAEHYASFAPELAAYWRSEEGTIPHRYHYHAYEEACYYGELREGLSHGYGSMVWDDNTYYIGEWSKGERRGMGLTLTADQRLYCEMFDDSGVGIIILAPGHQFPGVANSVVYAGYIENGKPGGRGAYYDTEGRMLYYGHIDNEGPTENYPTAEEASLYAWEREELPSGDSWEGETFNGVRHGLGVYHWADGSWWYGTWENGLREGSGLYVRSDGAIMTSVWSNDTL